MANPKYTKHFGKTVEEALETANDDYREGDEFDPEDYLPDEDFFGYAELDDTDIDFGSQVR